MEEDLEAERVKKETETCAWPVAAEMPASRECPVFVAAAGHSDAQLIHRPWYLLPAGWSPTCGRSCWRSA